jgi:chromodomain-helicase-DNA-binding protein 4
LRTVRPHQSCFWAEGTEGTGNNVELLLQETFADLTQNEHVQKLHAMLREHILRRIKKDVLTQMPPKREQIVRVELSDQQRDFYKQILVKQFPTLSGRHSAAGGMLKNVMMELRKCCNHPILFSKEEEALDRANVGDLVSASGKLQLLDRMMPCMKAQVPLLCVCPAPACCCVWTPS